MPRAICDSPAGRRGAGSVAAVQRIAFDPARLRAISHHGSAGFELPPLARLASGLAAVVVEAAALKP
jgi:hypothetical protein